MNNKQTQWIEEFDREFETLNQAGEIRNREIKSFITNLLAMREAEIKKAIRKLPEANKRTGCIGEKVYWSRDIIKTLSDNKS